MKAKELIELCDEEIQIELIGPYNEYSPAQEKAMALRSAGEIIRHIFKKEEDGKWYIEHIKKVPYHPVGENEQTIKYHGYKDCPSCGGKGNVPAGGGVDQCGYCKGTGMVLDKKPQLVNLGSQEKPRSMSKGNDFTKRVEFL